MLGKGLVHQATLGGRVKHGGWRGTRRGRRQLLDEDEDEVAAPTDHEGEEAGAEGAAGGAADSNCSANGFAVLAVLLPPGFAV